MLRESSTVNDNDFDLHQVTQGAGGAGGAAGDIAHAALLMRYAESVVQRDPAAITAARDEIREAMGAAALVDTAAVVAAFHGFVRVADAIGIPYEAAAGGTDSTALRDELGISDFHRARSG